MKHSLLPIKFKDHRTFDFHATFGTTAVMPSEFDFDVIGVFPDQNKDGFPNACTAYTVTGNASNDDKIDYSDKEFTYENTKRMMGVEGPVPCDQMTAMKSGTDYGVRAKGEDDALNNRRAPYFIVKSVGDKFGGLLSAMWTKQGTLNIGSYWPHEAEICGPSGIVPNFIVPKNWSTGHNWEACGVKIVAGEQRIVCKSWQSSSFGDKGYCYFSRQQINDLLSSKGSGAFGQAHARPEDIQRVKMTIIETIASYIRMIIGKFISGPKVAVIAPQPLPEPPKPSLRELIHQNARRWLGKDASPTNKAPQELACAESVCNILQGAGVNIPLLVSTVELNKWLRNSPLFKLTEEAKPGNIILSPTGSGNGLVTGHTGIFGEGEKIMSSDGLVGLWLENYSIGGWVKQFRTKGNMKIYYLEAL